MKPPPRSPFRIERLMHPRTVAVIGAGEPAGAQVLANLWASPFTGTIHAGEADTLPVLPDVAIVATGPAEVARTLASLGAQKCPAAIVLGDAPDLAGAARASGVRVLGPNSFGLAVPALGLNATRSHVPVPRGRLALVSQSASLSRMVIDWAEPNGVGFSHVVGLGGNADLGFRTMLDWLSHDPETGAILLDLRRIKHRSAFVSAVRAAARLRPVVAIRPGTSVAASLDAEADVAAPAFAAAMRRAGALSVDSLEGLLAAAETLSRAHQATRAGLVILGNSGSLARLAADAARRDGIALAALGAATRDALAAILPDEAVGPLLHAPPDRPLPVAEVAAVLARAPECGGLLVVLAPSGPADAASVAALAGLRAAALPLLVCVVGETTAAAHRRHLAQAGLPVFAGPEQAARGFLHLLRSRESRLAARELPPRAVLSIEPDREVVRQIFDRARAAGCTELTGGESLAVLAAYGIPAGPDGRAQRIRVAEDAMFGPVILLETPGGGAADLPPLNLALAQALCARAGVQNVAPLLVRVSQLVVDWPEIAALDLPVAGPGAIHLRAPAAEPLLSLPPYPAELTGHFWAHGEALTIRPIRPEDAEAHAALFRRLSPEDVRFRFFSSMRELSPEQMARMTQIDYFREIAFIAVRDAAGETVGVSRLVQDGHEGSGEFAVVVQPDMKGRGLARHLVERLIDWARSHALSEIEGIVLADNQPMLAFVRRLGFRVRHVPDDPELVQAVLELSS